MNELYYLLICVYQTHGVIFHTPKPTSAAQLFLTTIKFHISKNSAPLSNCPGYWGFFGSVQIELISNKKNQN